MRLSSRICLLILTMYASTRLFSPACCTAQERQKTHSITVTGRALDAEGQPIFNAEVFLVSPRTGEKLGIWFSDEKGEFRFDNIPLPIEKADTNQGRDSGSFEIFGRAKGHGFAYVPLKWFYPDREHVADVSPANAPEDQQSGFGTKDEIVLDLRFGPLATLRGRVVDEEGKGIPGARLVIRSVAPWRDDPARRVFESINDASLVPAEMRERTTDAAGRFEFAELPAAALFWISVNPPGYAPRSIYATTREGAKEDGAGKPVYSGDFEIAFRKARPITLQVVYGDTKKPAPRVGAGGNVADAGFWETTDESGIVKVRIPDGYCDVHLTPRIGTDYLEIQHELTITAESEQAPIVLELWPAAVVNVSVIDAETKQPLAGADVWWQPQTDTGIEYQEVRGWRSWEVETRISHYEEPRTDSKGHTRVLFHPGKHRIGVGLESWPAGYEAVEPEGREIDCKAGESVDAVFEMKKTEASGR